MDSIYIVAVAGASGAGKSQFARILAEQLTTQLGQNVVATLNEDCYYRHQKSLTYDQRCAINYDHPDAFEHELMVEQIKQLKQGLAVEVPQYNYQQHNRLEQTTKLEPRSLLIVEGILLFHVAALNEMFDLKIFVDVPLDICLIRRLRRDMDERGRSAESVLEQFETTVRPMFFQYVEPSMKRADLIVPHGGENLLALEVVKQHLLALINQR